jgi:hypothetical protein
MKEDRRLRRAAEGTSVNAAACLSARGGLPASRFRDRAALICRVISAVVELAPGTSAVRSVHSA